MRSRIECHWLYDCDRKTNGIAVGIFYVLAIAFSYLTLVVPRFTYVRIWLNDVMALLNAAYRVTQGQVPYLDFHTIYGPLVFYIPALGLRAGLQPSAIFAFDGVVVAAFVLLACSLAMYRRFALPITLITLVFLWLLIVVPVASGMGINDVTWGTYYNRHSWAALAVVLLFYVEPAEKRRYDKWIDTVVLSLLLLFLTYTKITFGIVGFAFVLANLFTTPYNCRISLVSILVAVVAIAIAQMFFGFHGMYLANILEVGATNPVFRSGYWGVISVLIDHSWPILACVGALSVCRAAGRRQARDWAYVFGAIVASILLLETTGGTWQGLPALIAVIACFGELARRTESMRDAAGARQWRERAGSLACLFLATMFVSEPVAARLIVWQDHYSKATRGTLKPLPDLPPELSGFLVPSDGGGLQDVWGHDASGHELLGRIRHVTGATLSAREYLSTVVEGAQLLRGMAFRDHTLFVLDNADPFTVALGMRPTPNGYPLLWATQLFSPERHPSGQEMFSGVDWVLIPTLPYDPVTTEMMMGFYGDYIAAHYDELARSPHWKLLARARRSTR